MADSLHGKRIVVTRPAAQAASLCAALRARGAEPMRCPTIRLAPAAHPGRLRTEARRVEEYDWVVFTSANGVAYTLEARGDRAWPHGVNVAAIGPVTAEALRLRGVVPALVPQDYVAESLAAELGALHGKGVLLPRAARARPVLAELLRAQGARVSAVDAYETFTEPLSHNARTAVQSGVDAITFTSSSTVEGFLSSKVKLAAGTVVACIGPVTARTARVHGLRVHVTARTFTTEGLVMALEQHYVHG